ncbi:MAG TPA: glycosyltransferase family 4 protein [Alphaproteobacteria bacterium]|jgi:glycosyltransferase involved in cell wall biosynthesis
MRVAFYAPLKPPSHPTPSGDRRIARLLLKALRMKGHDVRVVSTFRAYEGKGDRAKQEDIARGGAAEAERLLGGALKRWRPHAWFTYHLYQKAPDWLGPPITKKLGIPYLIAEAAYAPKRSVGRWEMGLAAVEAALRQADTALMLNPNDEECVAPLLRRRSGAVHAVHEFLKFHEFDAWKERAAGRPAAAEPLLPFLDPDPYVRVWRQRSRHRAALAARYGIPAEVPWLLAVGMMRAGDKLASYRLLAQALAGLTALPWRLLVVGEGPAEAEVHAAFAAFAERVHWLGALFEAALVPVYASADLFVWPAINEAIGMAILEAQAAGLAVVAGDVGAIGAIVVDGATGTLVPDGDAAAFRRAVAAFLGLPGAVREGLSRGAVAKVGLFHDIRLAAEQLDWVLHGAVARAKAKRR